MKSKSIQLESEQWAFVEGEALTARTSNSGIFRKLIQDEIDSRDMGFTPDEGRS